MERKQILLKYKEIPLCYNVYSVIPHDNLWDCSHWPHCTEEEIEGLIDYAKAFDYVDHNKLENSSRDGNTRPYYRPPEKSVCRSRSNS